MASEKGGIGKKGKTFGIDLKLKQNLTQDEVDHFNKVLDLAASALKLFIRDEIAEQKPQKPTGPGEPK